MKNRTITLLFAILIIGCKQKTEKPLEEVSQEATEILFQVKATDKDDVDYYEEGIIPWFSIAYTEPELNNLIDKDKIVLTETKAILIIDYPLKNPVEIEITASDSKGFSRKDLALQISLSYKMIYKIEEESAEIKTIPIEERKTLRNRNETNGTYGIWGHDIGDLVMPAAVIRKNDKGEVIIDLIIES
ncbi:hypothetical protein [uncultured Winogradskyella sp.]|uniref:hypothetical protein n=1 Tax=uncultured Winogradskyella sp. TaxID=395353 RepID=UPI002623AAD3|nr:hypothetical protein [uncultured Winogradskyella sp.]